MSKAGDLRVTILGCSGSYADAGGACTGYLVQSAGANIWLDCGPGTFANLQRILPLAELDAVVITHEHPDHWLELPVVHAAAQYYEPRPALPVYTTTGTRRLAKALRHDDAEPFAWTVVADGETHEIADQTWTFSQTEHYVETLAVRVDLNGRSFAFTADTGPGWEVGKLGPDLNLVLSESTFLADKEADQILHLSARQAGTAARNAGAERLVLTHLAPRSDRSAHEAEASAAFGGPVELASVGDTYTI